MWHESELSLCPWCAALSSVLRQAAAARQASQEGAACTCDIFPRRPYTVPAVMLYSACLECAAPCKRPPPPTYFLPALPCCPFSAYSARSSSTTPSTCSTRCWTSRSARRSAAPSCRRGRRCARPAPGLASLAVLGRGFAFCPLHLSQAGVWERCKGQRAKQRDMARGEVGTAGEACYAVRLHRTLHRPTCACVHAVHEGVDQPAHQLHFFKSKLHQCTAVRVPVGGRRQGADAGEAVGARLHQRAVRLGGGAGGSGWVGMWMRGCGVV